MASLRSSSVNSYLFRALFGRSTDLGVETRYQHEYSVGVADEHEIASYVEYERFGSQIPRVESSIDYNNQLHCIFESIQFLRRVSLNLKFNLTIKTTANRKA